MEELHRKLEEYLLHTDFQKNNEQIARSFVGQTQAHEALQGDLKTLEEGIGRQIFEAVRRATLKLTKQSVGGGEGGGVASEELRVVMQSKADRSELERVGQTKANKVDVEANMKAVDILHRHTSHLSTLVMEVVKAGMRGAGDSEQSRENQKAFLLRQARSVRQWISRFNPLSVNTYELAQPEELHAYEQHVSSTLDEVAQLAQKAPRSDSIQKASPLLHDGFTLPPQSKQLLRKEFSYRGGRGGASHRDSPKASKFLSLDSSSEDLPSAIRHSWSKSVLVAEASSDRQKRLGLSRRTDLSPRLPSISKV